MYQLYTDAMARSYQWVRTFIGGTTLSTGRRAWTASTVTGPTGGITLERVIFGFRLEADVVSSSGPIFDQDEGLTFGLIAAAEGDPLNFDPNGDPALDWLWVGHIIARANLIFQPSLNAVRLGWTTPAQQIETTTRRSFPEGYSFNLSVISATMPEFTDSSRPWGGSAYISSLFSTAA